MAEDTPDINQGAAKATADDELLARIRKWFSLAQQHEGQRYWRDENREAAKFDAGHQWTEDEKRILKDQLRPPVVFNRVHAVVSSVCGLEVGNRQEIAVKPREMGDVAVSEVLTAGVDWQRDGADAEDEESDAFNDTIVGGIGCIESRMDYEEDPLGKTMIERFDPEEFYYDPAAQRRNMTDTKFRMRVREIAIDDARSMFPDAEDGDLDAGWATDGPTEARKRVPDDYPKSGGEEDKAEDRSMVRIVQCQWWDREPVMHVADPAGGMTTLTMDEVKKLQERGMPVQGAQSTRKVFKQAFVGAKVLKSGPGPCKYEFTLLAITGKRDKEKKCWYGLVRHMMDPQRWANKWLSQTMHIMNTNAKGGIIIEEGMMVNPNKFQEEWARPDSVSVVKAGAIAQNRFMMKPAITFPSGMDMLMQFAISSIRDVSGVNLELLGMADREQAGVLEAQRKRASVTILTQFFDALRLYRKQNGRVLVYFMQNYYSPQRLARVLGEEMASALPTALQADVVRYDIVVDEVPTSPNQKEMTWAALQMVLPVFAKMLPPPAFLALMRYGPWPEKLVQELMQAMQQASQPDPMVEQAKQIDLADKAAQAQKSQAEVAKTVAETEGQQLENTEKQIGMAVGMHVMRRDGIPSRDESRPAA